MKRKITAVIALCLLGGMFISPSAEERPVPIIPAPKEFQRHDGIFHLPETAVLWAPAQQKALAGQIAASLKNEAGIPASVQLLPQDLLPQDGIVLLKTDSPAAQNLMKEKGWNIRPEMHKEGYLLEIGPRRAVLLADTDAGLFYAGQTLIMLAISYGRDLPQLSIRDWPDFQFRGVTDDISRGQVSTMQNFQKIIRFLARHKMNVYMPYIEDVFRFKHFPQIGKGRGALSAEEWLALQDYATQYHVEIIPIFQTLGHYENILSLPEFRHLAEFPGAASLRIGDPETYKFLSQALDEVTAAFRSKYFHMGADESWDVGAWSTRKLAERYGLATLHAMHYNRVFKMLKARGKTVMMYGDIILNHPTILNQIPKDVIIFDWHYRISDHYPSAETFRLAGQPFIVSPAIWNWNRIFPNLTDAFANIRQFVLDGLENGALGAVTSNWGDFGGPNLRELNYYPYAFAADCAWNAKAADPDRFARVYFQTYYGPGTEGLGDVFYLLNEISQQMDWPHFFSHPFYPPPEDLSGLIRQSVELPLYAEKIQESLREIAPRVLRHKDELPLFAFCARQAKWYGDLQALRLNLHQTNRYVIDDSLRRVLIPVYRRELQRLRDEILSLKSDYQALWLATNRPANLDRLLALFDRLATYLEVKSEEIQAGDFSFSGRLPSAFVSHPFSQSGKAVSTLYLRKTFSLDQKPDEAWLQLIADSHARIWLNGKEIGEVVARRTLSAMVESQRVRAWEVAKYLRKGKNVLAVWAKNYIPGRSAAANVFLQWRNSGTWAAPLTTDAYWKCSDREEQGWKTLHFDDSGWLNAVTAERPWTIARPYFSRKLPSRIEFY